jgi:hypothetical protein
MSRLFEAVKQQRIGLACAITVGAVLITLSHAPVIPVITGCVLALALLIGRAWSKLFPSRMGR